MWRLMLIFLPVVAVVLVLAGDWWAEVVALAMLAAIFVSVIRISFFRCPRCKTVFHSSKGYSSILTRQCAVCGLDLDSLRQSHD